MASGWSQFLIAATLVLVRISGAMIFVPFFSSAAIPNRIKIGFVLVLTWLLAPIAANLPGSHAAIGMVSVLSELTTGLIFGLSLTLLMEILGFAGQVLGFQFSFSLVNVLDPNSSVDTPLLSQFLQLIGVLVILAAGLDRTLLAALMRTFIVVPVGTAWLSTATSVTLVRMASGIFLAGVQLAAPVLAATLLVELAVNLVGRLHAAGGAGRQSGGPAISATAGVVCGDSAENAGGVCGADRLARDMAALHRSPFRHATEPGDAPGHRFTESLTA